MTTKTKFKTNPVAKKWKEENLERERATQESVKQIKISTKAPASIKVTSFIGMEQDTTYWSKTGTDVKEFDLDSALALARNEGYEEGQEKKAVSTFWEFIVLLFAVVGVAFAVIGLFNWIVTH